MALNTTTEDTALGEDHSALAAACDAGVGLCTIVGIEGSFSRKRGAQLAVLPDGSTVGSLSDNCLEAQLVSDLLHSGEPRVLRYGRGSSKVDFRLPCGGGLDIHLDPHPDKAVLRRIVARLRKRQPSSLSIEFGGGEFVRHYKPNLRLMALGEGPELAAISNLAREMRIDCLIQDRSRLSLGRSSPEVNYDPWTACLLLFHDHEWELPLIEQALATDAFYIGAQGGERARTDRLLALTSLGISEEDISRITSPVGVIPSCKTPGTLALSAIAEIVQRYDETCVRF